MMISNDNAPLVLAVEIRKQCFGAKYCRESNRTAGTSSSRHGRTSCRTRFGIPDMIQRPQRLRITSAMTEENVRNDEERADTDRSAQYFSVGVSDRGALALGPGGYWGGHQIIAHLRSSQEAIWGRIRLLRTCARARRRLPEEEAGRGCGRRGRCRHSARLSRRHSED